MFITAVIHLDSNGKHFLPATARIEWISTLLFVSLLVGLLGSSCSPICSQSRSSLFFLIPLLRTYTLYISDFLKGDLFSFISPSSGWTDRMCRVRVGDVMLRGVKPLDSSQEILFNVLFFNLESTCFHSNNVSLLHLLLFLHCEPQSDRRANQLTRKSTESRHLRTKTERRTFIRLLYLPKPWHREHILHQLVHSLCRWQELRSLSNNLDFDLCLIYWSAWPRAHSAFTLAVTSSQTNTQTETLWTATAVSAPFIAHWLSVNL